MAVIRVWGLMVMRKKDEKFIYKAPYMGDWNLVVPGKGL